VEAPETAGGISEICTSFLLQEVITDSGHCSETQLHLATYVHVGHSVGQNIRRVLLAAHRPQQALRARSAGDYGFPHIIHFLQLLDGDASVH
jgi:hypothetical protein